MANRDGRRSSCSCRLGGSFGTTVIIHQHQQPFEQLGAIDTMASLTTDCGDGHFLATTLPAAPASLVEDCCFALSPHGWQGQIDFVLFRQIHAFEWDDVLREIIAIYTTYGDSPS
ncbi:hypothetical protein IV203_033719 [Nitzschia inconspicua]|uniref:Uncharacterized protein n=1 Tax=Nitzschia inconspicua TaxID=303405 RepID=A0A9K3M2V8_9STRA|nr:hypothetical protein IV203_033719 [Nitzschia inconspicua]